jgi:hypothetical protein
MQTSTELKKLIETKYLEITGVSPYTELEK